MRRRALRTLILAAALAAAPGCGKKGPIQAPLVRIPQAVEGFKAFQRGGAFRLEWKLPGAYIDGTPFPKPVEVEVWVVEEDVAQPPSASPAAPSDKPRPDEGQKGLEAKPVAGQPAGAKAAETKTAETKPAATVPAETPAAGKEQQPGAIPAAPPPAASTFVSGEMPLELFKEKAVLAASLPADFGAAKPDAGSEADRTQSFERPLDPARLDVRATFAVRVKDHRRKYSDYSSRITLVPRALPGPPRDVRLTLYEDKIVLAWEPPASGPDPAAAPVPSGYNVYRSRGEEPSRLLNEGGPEKAPGYADKTFAFGETYRYTVRAVLGETPPRLESADSEAASIAPKDTFPPAAPGGLKTVAGPGFISLSWEDGPEADLAGYRVWRKAAAEEEFRPLTEEPIRETNYVDRAVQAGSRYVYALSALDKSGNESRRAKAVSETARSPRP